MSRHLSRSAFFSGAWLSVSLHRKRPVNFVARVLAASLVILSAMGVRASAAQIGAWQFDNSLNNNLAGRAAMTANGGWSPTYSSTTIGGNSATALSFPAFNNTQSLQMPNQAPPNGGANTNSWSIVMDVNFPTIGGFISLWQTDQNIAGSDGDFFINGSGAIGIGGNYQGTVPANTWTRIAVTLRPNGSSYELKKYINGALVGTTSSGTPPDGRHSVGAVLNLFADEDGETGAGLVNSVAYYDQVLTADAISALGGATAGGIPAVPEPTSLALGVVATIALLTRRRRGA
jgi:hypothetical protein